MKAEVTVHAQCLMPEKLIERATAQGARFDAVRRPNARALAIDCDAASARTLLALCRRYSVPARVTRRRGGSALRRFARARGTLPVGLAMGIVLCALFLGRIWKVDVAFTGNNAARGDRAAVERALAELGVRPGASADVNTRLITRSLQAQMPEYSYVGARVQGVRLLVEAVPEAPAPQLYDVDAARDLVADRDGIVVRAVARSGELCVSAGDAVRRGQVLIRGEELSGKEETRPIAALGEVIVRAWARGEASLPLYETRTRFTGSERAGLKLSVPGFEWTLRRVEPFGEQTEDTEYLPIGGMFLPVELERRTLRETQSERVNADRDAIKARLCALALADAARQLSRENPANCEITDSWVSCSAENGALRAQAVYEIHADAAVTREALLQGG